MAARLPENQKKDQLMGLVQESRVNLGKYYDRIYSQHTIERLNVGNGYLLNIIKKHVRFQLYNRRNRSGLLCGSRPESEPLES